MVPAGRRRRRARSTLRGGCGALLGRLDVLVNNAGMGVMATALDTPLEDFDRVMDVNVRGFSATRSVLPTPQRRRGCMIHIGSDAGVLGETTIAVYSVSKAAVHMLSNVLAIEGGAARRAVERDRAWGHRTRACGTWAPRAIRTARRTTARTLARASVGRIGRAVDVAEAAVYLASERSSFVNGVALLVDVRHARRLQRRSGRQNAPVDPVDGKRPPPD